MTDDRLRAAELIALIQRVFSPGASERSLAILVDLPDGALADNDDWRLRRELAAGWALELEEAADAGLEVGLYGYRNARANNADLPEFAWRLTAGESPACCAEVEGRPAIPFDEVLTRHRLALAPTELSATAPLKMMARRLGFRAATMPGFSPAMVPALRLDYTEVNRQVRRLKELLDEATAADLLFRVDGAEEHRLHLDLRHRSAHASGGLLPEPGTAGNLPSGEAYIVPYEGELANDPTATAGVLPVQLGQEVVLFRIAANRAREVLTRGEASQREAALLAAEPARGNIAELGLGVLAGFGVAPVGEVLLDEKLGLHVAFGRSEHFGGQVGPAAFSRPEAVIHQDHVYIPELQPRIEAAEVTLDVAGRPLLLMQAGRYAIEL